MFVTFECPERGGEWGTNKHYGGFARTLADFVRFDCVFDDTENNSQHPPVPTLPGGLFPPPFSFVGSDSRTPRIRSVSGEPLKCPNHRTLVHICTIQSVGFYT